MKYKLFFHTIILLSFCLFSSCASVKPTIYELQKIKKVKKWKVDFTYEPGEVERKVEDEKISETKIITGGRSARDLQLRDDIAYFLQDNYFIKIDKTGREADGQILINTVNFYTGGFKSVDITLADSTGLTLARIRVQNGDRRTTFKEDYDFAEYAAESISEVIGK